MIVISKFCGPADVVVINGKDTTVEVIEDNSIFAFSAASLIRCIAIKSFFNEIPELFSNSVKIYWAKASLKSSPPR